MGKTPQNGFGFPVNFFLKPTLVFLPFCLAGGVSLEKDEAPNDNPNGNSQTSGNPLGPDLLGIKQFEGGGVRLNRVTA